MHLSNENIYYPIQRVLSIISFKRFGHLRSLALTRVKEKDLEELKKKLPSMTELMCFRVINCEYETEEILCSLSLSQLRTLIISELPKNLTLMNKTLPITNLTTSFSTVNDLSQIFNSTPNLKYLKIEEVLQLDAGFDAFNPDSINHAAHLKKLIINRFKGVVDNIFMLLKYTSNLRSLTINTCFDSYRIDADEWKDLINSSLPHLSEFKFYFEWWIKNEEEDEIVDKLKQFQCVFWCKQHHWYTEYILSPTRASIYTIPYAFDKYSLKQKTTRYSNSIMNNIMTFDRVKDLIVEPSAVTEKYQYRFSYVTSLTLEYPRNLGEWDHFLRIEDIKNLKMIVNLCHVKHLNLIMDFHLDELQLLLIEILKEGKQISSLDMDPCVLEELFDNDELCKYLNKMIKKLHIYVSSSDIRWNCSPKIKQFCQVFSNIEQLTCDIENLDD